MSRLIVKNIPVSSTEDTLRKLFSQAGTLTEVQLKKTKKGKHRGFAFIGYHNEVDADAAIKLYHKTYIDTGKVTVEKCKELKEAKEKLEKGQVKKEEVTEKEMKLPPTKKVKKKEEEVDELLKKYKDDPLFEEFMQVHDVQKSKKLRELQASREEEDSEVKHEVSEDANEEKESQVKKKEKKKKDVQLFSVILRNLPWEFNKRDIKDFFKPLKCFSIRLKQRALRVAYVGFLAERFRSKALLKDKSFMKGFCVRVAKIEKTVKDNEEEDGNKKWQKEENTAANLESIGESGRIFLRNLSYTTTEDDIEKLFTKYGPLAEVNLPFDSNSKTIKGFGTVTFVMPEHALKAFTELDGTILHGRMLHLLPGKSKDSPEDNDEESTNYKDKKRKTQKAQAGKSHNWNALFVDANAVAEVVAERYGTTKEAIVGPDSKGSAPVKLALAETQIVAETKKYLEDMGVKLDAFNKDNVKRSKSVILVKNLPSKTSASELKDVFQKYGELGRIVLPPSGLTGLIEFLSPSEARKAFIGLAYSKFKNVPLYLEWAPHGSLEGNELDEDELKSNTNNVKSAEVKEPVKEIVNEKKVEKVKKPEQNTVLCVKNLNPSVTNAMLKEHFETCGEVYYAQIRFIKKKSSGIGFVRFLRKSSAEMALQKLQGSNLGNSSIEITKSDRIEDVDAQIHSTDKPENTKTSTIIVKNIAFEATSKEVENVFSTFGNIKTVRLPRKWNTENQHRGFGFVEFVNENDAKSAFEALSQSTHLLGRRLVLEWAKDEENVEETRKRTSEHFGGPKLKKSKKSVFNISS